MISALDEPAAVPRERLLARLRRARPRLVSLVAPAGFGKTTVARLYAGEHAGFTTCDCLGVRSDEELATRLLTALAAENPQRQGSLAQEQLAAAAQERGAVALALEAFRTPGPGATMLIDNLERLADVRGASELMNALLDRPHPSRRLILCSREPLPFRTSAFSPPHIAMLLRAADLRFDRREIACAFAAAPIAPERLDAIESITRGWPIAVLLLARFAAEGRLDDVLADLHDVEYDQLFDYLVNEVFAGLSSATLAELLVACAVPDLTLDEWRSVRSDDDARAAVLALPFVALDGERIDVHPLVRATIEARYPSEIRAIVSDVAERLANRLHGARSAALYLAIGDTGAAARAITAANGTAFLLSDFPQRAAEIIGALDEATLAEFPELWSASTVARIFVMDQRSFLDENRRMWARYRDAPALPVRLGVFNNIENATVLNGQLDEADAALDHFRKTLGEGERFVEPLCAMWEDTLRAFRGQTAQSEEIPPERAPFLQADTTSAIWSYNIGARRQRLLGDRAAEHRHVAAAVEAADRTGDALTIALVHCDAAFSAWFWGDDAALESHLRVVEASLTPRVQRGFSFFVACARGRGRTAEPAFEEFKFRSFAYLLAAASEPEPTIAARHARDAVIAADQSGQAFPRIVSRVAQGWVESSERDRALAAALTLAEATESAALAGAVRGIAAGEPAAGMLAAFGARFAVGERRAARALCVELLGARVSVDGREVALRPREFLIVAALALVPGPLDGSWFTAMLWPQTSQAANRFYVTLARLRAKLGADAVTRSTRGYALAPHATVDLDVMEERIRRLPRTLPVSAAQRDELRSYDERLRAASPMLGDQDWLQPTQMRVERLRRDVETLLAQDASARSDHDGALTYAQRMVERDPCDEVACEIGLRAWMAKDDRSAALRCLREYEAVLRRELGVAPSRYLAELVKERG